MPLGLTARQEPGLQLIIGQVDVANGLSDHAGAHGRNLIECQRGGAGHKMNSADVTIERIGQRCRDDRGDVAGVHVAGWGRADRTVEFARVLIESADHSRFCMKKFGWTNVKGRPLSTMRRSAVPCWRPQVNDAAG